MMHVDRPKGKSLGNSRKNPEECSSELYLEFPWEVRTFHWGDSL